MTKHLDPIAHARNEALEVAALKCLMDAAHTDAASQLAAELQQSGYDPYYQGQIVAAERLAAAIRALKTPEPE